MTPDQMKDFSAGIFSVSLFLSNLYFMEQQVNYFAASSELHPLLHTWSLAVEEQFYIFFPILLLTLFKRSRQFAVTALMGKYEDSQGRDSKVVTGKESSTETYRSMAEVVRDMNKPEYTQDEAFRDDVLRKLSASNLKV